MDINHLTSLFCPESIFIDSIHYLIMNYEYFNKVMHETNLNIEFLQDEFAKHPELVKDLDQKEVQILRYNIELP